MRNCLLLSGLPRKVTECYSNIYETIIVPNNCDVFIHTWGDREDDVFRFVQENYQPKVMVVEKQKQFYNDKLDFELMLRTYAHAYDRHRFVEMLYSSWYSTLQANLLKEEYRLANSTEYNYVIRARFDIVYSKAVRVADYDSNQLNINFRGDLPNEMVDDKFSFASNSIMNLYASGFTLLESIYKKKYQLDQIFCGETLVYELMKIFNIPCNVINDITITKVQ